MATVVAENEGIRFFYNLADTPVPLVGAMIEGDSMIHLYTWSAGLDRAARSRSPAPSPAGKRRYPGY